MAQIKVYDDPCKCEYCGKTDVPYSSSTSADNLGTDIVKVKLEVASELRKDPNDGTYEYKEVLRYLCQECSIEYGAY